MSSTEDFLTKMKALQNNVEEYERAEKDARSLRTGAETARKNTVIALAKYLVAEMDYDDASDLCKELQGLLKLPRHSHTPAPPITGESPELGSWR